MADIIVPKFIVDPFILPGQLKKDGVKEKIITKEVLLALMQSAAFFAILGLSVAFIGHVIISILAERKIIIINSSFFSKSKMIATIVFSCLGSVALFVMVPVFGVLRKKRALYLKNLSRDFEKLDIEQIIKKGINIFNDHKPEEEEAVLEEGGLEQLLEALEIEGVGTYIFSFLCNLNISRVSKKFLISNDYNVCLAIEGLRDGFSNDNFKKKMDSLLIFRDQREVFFLSFAIERVHYLKHLMEEYKEFVNCFHAIFVFNHQEENTEFCERTKALIDRNELGNAHSFTNIARKIKNHQDIHVNMMKRLVYHYNYRLDYRLTNVSASYCPIEIDGNHMSFIPYGEKLNFCNFKSIKYFPVLRNFSEELKKLYISFQGIETIPEDIYMEHLEELIICYNSINYENPNNFIPLLKSFPNLNFLQIGYQNDRNTIIQITRVFQETRQEYVEISEIIGFGRKEFQMIYYYRSTEF